ncbi:hypothetical protein MYOV003v1_p0185 [Vibrio phage 207E48.1]|nr:hypothetical protein MYOV003v1_p0185 [Vibrio phage 207E48.1]
MDPKLDGVTHINIYSRGGTELGQLMSNFTRSPFTLKEHGRFDSIEGLWYWLALYNHDLPPNHDHNLMVDTLRAVSGTVAKNRGRELKLKLIAYAPDEMPEDAFQDVINEAIGERICNDDRLVALLNDSTLPFTHYYVFNGVSKDANNHPWLLECWERARRILKRMIKREEAYEVNRQQQQG